MKSMVFGMLGWMLAVGATQAQPPQAPQAPQATAVGVQAAVSAAAAAAAARFAPEGEKALRDTRTGLRWTQRENGYAMDWFGARDYCQKLDGAWRLPEAAEFASIQDDVRLAAKPCADATCKSETPFRLADGWLWSATSNGIDQAIGINLLTGMQQPTYRAKRHRALCVSGT